jgi:DNA repair photolyase
VSALVGAGIKASVGMAPLLPGLSDRPELVADVVRAARAAGATGIWASFLHLKPGTREHFLAALQRDWPELLPEYERLYAGRAYLPAEETRPGREQVAALAAEHGIRDRRRVRLEPPPDPEQLKLAV